MNKKWELNEANDVLINKISEEFNVSKLVANIIANKGLTNSDEIEVFLHPRRTDFHDPFMMPDMEKAVDRVVKAIETHEKVAIYGDYDVDGITSITVLKSFLKDRGFDVGEYIPNRLSEGYGINMEAVKKIAEEGYKLMITVDCGISAVEEVQYATELGIETIVTDHHEPGDEIPKALAVVDAKRKDNQYQCRNLAGVGVVFKLIQAISMRTGLEEKEYLKYLDIVCLGTISDIVPLTDENRVIVKLGLKLVQQTKNLGLKAILQSTGYNKIDSIAISFGVAPRINACGRMGHQEDALNLFLSKDINDVNELSAKLNQYNKERQEIEKNIFAEAVKQIERDNLENNTTITLLGKNWHHGVIGIVASKITEMYYKPSILLCEEDGIGKGSGRSIPGFDLYETLTECKDSIDRFGGHEMAVGITIDKEKFEEFREKFEEKAKEKHIEEIIPILKIDSQLSLDEIDKQTVDSLKAIEPFGEENKNPLFLFKNLKIDSIRALTEGKHLKLTVKENKNIVNAIGFNLGTLANEYKIGDKVDIVGNLEMNSFNGVDSIQINIKDIMKSL